MNKIWAIFFTILLVTFSIMAKESSWIRINQLGYLPNSTKVAVLASKSDITCQQFEIVNSK